MPRYDHLHSSLGNSREKLLNHRLYVLLTLFESLHVFMEHHVFVARDFMSLRKSLQRAFCMRETRMRRRVDLKLRILFANI
jgi:hypothetical protein